MLSNKEIRALSREQLRGNWSKFVLINLVMLILAGGSTYLSSSKQMPFMSLVQIVVQLFIVIGIYRLLLDIARGKGFNFSNFWQPGRVYLRYILASLLLSLLILAINVIVVFILLSVTISMFIGGTSSALSGLGTESIYPLLGNITGGLLIFLLLVFFITLAINLYIGFTYQMTDLIIVNNHDDVGAIDSLTASRKLMKGYKWRFFKLNLSFIGWVILAILSLGIGTLWLTTYIYMSVINFYLELLKEREELAKDLHLVEPVAVSASNVYTGESQDQISGVEEVKDVEVAPVEDTEDSTEDSEK